MATAAEKKAAKEAEEAAAAAAAEELAAAELAATEAAAAAEVVVETPADETPEEEAVEEDAEEAPVDAPIITPEEDAQAKTAAVLGVGVAVSPLEAPEQAGNPAERDSDPNVPEGLNAVIEAVGHRGDESYLAAEDGEPIDLETLWIGPDASGQVTSTVRIVEHSTIPPYGHPVTTLVIGAGSPTSIPAAAAISNRLKAQQDASEA